MKSIGKSFGIVMVVIFALVVGLCVACTNDDDNDSMPLRHKDRGGHQDDGGHNRENGRNSRGKCEKADTCDDRDFSPELTDSPVTICLPQSTCNFGEGEQASLVPPNPEKLVGAISAMTKGIGDAAGALAGAIAGGTIGILLEA